MVVKYKVLPPIGKSVFVTCYPNPEVKVGTVLNILSEEKGVLRVDIQVQGMLHRRIAVVPQDWHLNIEDALLRLKTRINSELQTVNKKTSRLKIKLEEVNKELAFRGRE